MRAIVCERPNSLIVVDRQSPRRGDDDVVVAIRRVGLCGTDFHIYAGNQPFLEYPRVMGHELSGEVIEAPVGSPWRPGQLVAINPYLACGTCIACRRGKPNCCVRIKVLGVHTDGGLCERIAVPESALIDATGLTPDQAAMVEFLAIGAHAVRRAVVAEGERVLVVGAGPIGIAAALFARFAGATVTLLDTRQARLGFARDTIGIVDVVTVGGDVASDLAARTDDAMFDCVFDATGNIRAMRVGLDYVAHGGRYVLISVVKDDLVFPDPEFHKRETTLLASRNALAADFEHVVARIRDGSIPTDALHTHSVAAEDLPEQFPRLIADADQVLKAIARF